MILMVGGSTAQLTPARSADEWSKLFLREAASEVHSRFQNECQLLRPELNRLQPWRKSAPRPSTSSQPPQLPATTDRRTGAPPSACSALCAGGLDGRGNPE